MPEISHTGSPSMFESALAFRYSTNVDASSSPNRPNPITADGTAITKRTGCTSSSWIPNRTRPHTSVETSETSPNADVARVSGTSTTMNGAGAVIRS